MRYLLLFYFLLAVKVSSPAQNTPDTSASLTMKELQLSNEQVMAIKKLLQKYKAEEKEKRDELRHKILFVLNRRQQMMVRQWWRNHRRGFYWSR